MASLNNSKSTNSGLQEGNSEPNDEERNELCPGFKDVDAFVKVSVPSSTQQATWMSLLAKGCIHNTNLRVSIHIHS